MSSLEDALKDAEITEEIAQEFETIASQYVTAVIHNITKLCYVNVGCSHFYGPRLVKWLLKIITSISKVL